MKFTKTVLIASTEQLVKNPPQRGQWIQLDWLDKPSRFHSIRPSGSIWATHYPQACQQFNALCKGV